VVSLFTGVLIVDLIELLIHHFEDDVLILFKHVLTSTYFWWRVLRTNGRGSNGLTIFSGNCEILHGGSLEESNRTSGTKVCMLVQICKLDVRHLAPWPRKTDRISDHLNRLHKTLHYKMEIEKEGHLPFLETDIYRKSDGSIGHKEYRKPTQTNL
jgi:hypothetical protein